MSAARDHFVRACDNMVDRPTLPAVAILGDVCKHQGKFWVYEMDMGKTTDGFDTLVGKWFTLEEAANRVYPVEFSAPIAGES